MDRLQVFPSELIFTETKESVSGKVVEGSESTFLGYIIRQRILPRLDDRFRPTGETYRLWEACWGDQSWFAPTLFDIHLRILELG